MGASEHLPEAVNSPWCLPTDESQTTSMPLGAGGIQAYESFYRGHFADTCHTAVQYGSPHPEDTAQEVFATAWEKRHSIHAPAGWLRTATHHRCVSEWRKRQARPQPADQSVYELPVVAPDNPAETAVNRILARQIIRYAAAELPPRQGEVFLLVRVQGLSEEAAAEELGIAAGTIKVHLHRATQNLRDHFASWEKDV